MGKHIKFPPNIVSTSLSPDMVLLSEASKLLVIIELTVPGEDCMGASNKRKQAKYQELVGDCQKQGC